MRLPRSIAGWTIAVFGVLALVMGAVGLLWPQAQLQMLGFEIPTERAPGDYTGTFLLASSMAAFNMGVYYLLAAATEWRSFYRFTVVFRLVTFAVFSIAVVAGIAPDRFFGVALWEGIGAAATAVGLWLDARRSTANGPTEAGSTARSGSGAAGSASVSAGKGGSATAATAARADTAD
ncbi:hypothetical protein ABT336_18285 [Micromonospora sp. NPDC000207]|uniref:hypothetical protein n=1 Tax=Micromonospora sp. NPDC000207 TaxID=3154246 RepID=UPI00331D055F